MIDSAPNKPSTQDARTLGSKIKLLFCVGVCATLIAGEVFGAVLPRYTGSCARKSFVSCQLSKVFANEESHFSGKIFLIDRIKTLREVASRAQDAARRNTTTTPQESNSHWLNLTITSLETDVEYAGNGFTYTLKKNSQWPGFRSTVIVSDEETPLGNEWDELFYEALTKYTVRLFPDRDTRMIFSAEDPSSRHIKKEKVFNIFVTQDDGAEVTKRELFTQSSTKIYSSIRFHTFDAAINVLVYSDGGGDGCGGTRDYHSYNLETNEKKLLAETGTGCTDPLLTSAGFSPDGKLILGVRQEITDSKEWFERGLTRLYLLDPITGAQEDIKTDVDLTQYVLDHNPENNTGERKIYLSNHSNVGAIDANVVVEY